MTQTDLFEFEQVQPNPLGFDDYGPTSEQPIPLEERATIQRHTWPYPLDERELTGTGLSASDVDGVINVDASGLYLDWKKDSFAREPADHTQLINADLAALNESGEGSKPVATDGGQQMEPAEGEAPPSNETVLIISGITRLQHSPHILEGETSSSGKTIAVEAPNSNSTRRLDTETILSGESEFRKSRYYELYTPGRMRSRQRTNLAHGPEVGASRVSDVSDLPNPTHWPAAEQPEEAPEVCQNCGRDPDYWEDKVRPQCGLCGEIVPEPEEDKSESRKQYERNEERVEEIERGQVLLLDAQAGEYLVTSENRDVAGTLRGYDLIDEDGNEYTLRVYLYGGKLFDLQPDDEETMIVRNVANVDDIQDFEVIRTDEDWLKSWIRARYD